MSENIQMDPPTILCDMCTEEDRKPAKKTCMKCEISMCVQHLQAHLTTPVLLQTHPLTEPMALCGNTKCSQHGKLLEYYCLDDMTCVCVSCAIEDQHRLHNTKTFSTAHKELLEKLKAEQQILQEKTDDEDVSLEKWEKSEREKLDCCSDHLTETVTNLHDISLTNIQSSVSVRMVFFKTSKSSIEAALKEKDTFRFLQMYSQVHQDVEKAKAVDLRKGLEPGSDRNKLVEKIRQNGEKMVMQTSQFWGSLLTLVDPENHQELIPSRSDLIFDPQVLGPGMSLSKDKRKVFFHHWLGQCCATLWICSTKKVCKYQRWMVSLSKHSNWMIGLRHKQFSRCFSGPPVYGLCCEGNWLSSLTVENDDVSQLSTLRCLRVQNPAETKFRTTYTLLRYQGKNGDVPVPRPEKVEVLWNFDAFTLSFFRRTGLYQREEITTIKVKANSENKDLTPFVLMGKGSMQYHPQQQQMSSRENVYRRSDNLFPEKTGFVCSQRGYCSCDKVVNGPQITEMVCELY